MAAQGGWRKANIIIGLVFILIGGAVLWNGLGTTSSDARLRAEGTKLTADIVDAQRVTQTRRGATVSTEYQVKYRFVAGGALTAGGRVIISDWTDVPESIARGKQVDILYLASDPNVNKPIASLGDESSIAGLPLVNLIVLALCVVVGGWIIVSGRPRPAAAAAGNPPAAGAN